MYQEAVLPSLTASTKLAVPQISPPAKIYSWDLDCMVFSLKLIIPVLGSMNSALQDSFKSAPKAVIKWSQVIT